MAGGHSYNPSKVEEAKTPGGEGSAKLNSVNEKVLEKKRLTQQLSVKGLSSQGFNFNVQHSSGTHQLNFKKLAGSSSQLKLGLSTG